MFFVILSHPTRPQRNEHCKYLVLKIEGKGKYLYRNNNDKDHDDEKMGKLDSRLKEVGVLPSYDFDQQGYTP